jgi:hypothetical protein
MKAYVKVFYVLSTLSFAVAALARDVKIDMLAAQPDGLHKAAIASGGTYLASGGSPPKFKMMDLNQLVADSTTIVVASVQSAKSELSDEGRQIKTRYTLNVIQTVKGDSGNTELLTMRGGTYAFPDGTVVSQVEPASKELRVGITYILFLKHLPNDRGTLRVVSPGQGVFEVASDGQHLISYTYVQNDPLSDEADSGKLAFLKKVQAIVSSESS